MGPLPFKAALGCYKLHPSLFPPFFFVSYYSAKLCFTHYLLSTFTQSEVPFVPSRWVCGCLCL